MKTSIRLAAIVMFYVYGTSLSYAGCEALKQEIATVQDKAKEQDFNIAKGLYDQIGQAGRTVRSMCIDNIGNIDTTSTGMSSAMSKVLMAAANKLCDSAAQQVSQVTAPVYNAANKAQSTVTNYPSTIGNQIGGDMGNVIGSQVSAQVGAYANQSIAQPAQQTTASIWDKAKNLMGM